MAKPSVRKYREAAKELRRYLDSEKHRSMQPEQAFLRWYAEARFGALQGLTVVDGKNDGGIDALVENDGRQYVIQSKYEVVPSASLVTRSEIAGFEKVVGRFQDPDGGDEFAAWLDTVRPELRRTYSKVRERTAKDPSSVRFVFVTTKRFRLAAGEAVEIEDLQHVAALWDLYREGFTPATEAIELTLTNPQHTGSEAGDFRTYVGLADVLDFLVLMRDDRNERLFAQNVRTDLRSRINREIRQTYEREPDRFWLGNNGIYIVCKQVVSSGSQYKLVYPSIINGSQTLHSISTSHKRHSCKILVRILEMDVLGNPKLLGAVIRRTNTQNPMKLINLSAHDACQLNVARFLDRFRIFYERREREWANEKKTVLTEYRAIDMKAVAQWLSTRDPAIGLGRARSRTSELFQGNLYTRIFGGFDRQLKSTDYDKLVITVWAGLFIDGLLASLPRKWKTYGRISHLALIKATVAAIEANQDLNRQIPESLRQHRFGWRYVPARAKAPFKKMLKELVRLQRAKQRQESNLDFTNFFKRDDLTQHAFQRVFTPRARASVARAILHSLPTIE